MTNTKNDPPKGGQRPADPQAAQAGKRPYATLDLKATEIKVTSIAEKTAAAASGATPSAAPAQEPPLADPPRPAPAWTYAMAKEDTGKPETSAHSAKDAETPRAKQVEQAPAVTVGRRGGFFGHLAAGLVGGALALAGSQWLVPHLGALGLAGEGADNSVAVDLRLAALEKKLNSADVSQKLQNAELRLGALEKSAELIPALKEAHTKLAADTKAALAAAASNAGVPEELARIASIEDKLKSLSEVAASDPSAGRVPQLALLTGKIADLETGLATQLTVLRKSVTDDVNARVGVATQSSENAIASTQRFDKDIAAIKGDAQRLAERVQALKSDDERTADSLRSTQEATSALKAALESLKGSTAKPADVASAIAPLTEKIASLEQNVQGIVKTEADRRSSAENIVLSLELQNLKRVLDRGQKYAAELAEVQKAAGGKMDLSALAKYKDQGVATISELSQDFRKTANAVIDSDSEPADQSVVGRLIAGAKSVVRVRQINHAPDDKGTEAVVGRMEASLKDGHLGDVLEQSKALSPKALDVAGPFLDKVAARHGVDLALAALESQLKSSLSAVPGDPQKSVQ